MYDFNTDNKHQAELSTFSHKYGIQFLDYNFGTNQNPKIPGINGLEPVYSTVVKFTSGQMELINNKLENTSVDELRLKAKFFMINDRRFPPDAMWKGTMQRINKDELEITGASVYEIMAVLHSLLEK
jgi:hypothetical protein